MKVSIFNTTSSTANQKEQGALPVKVEMVGIISSIEATVRQIENSLDTNYNSLKDKKNIFPTDVIIQLDITFDTPLNVLELLS